MGRNLSPLVQEELQKLEKDPESRRLAMKTLKSYATNIDSKAIPQFLAQVSENNNQGSPSGECTISLFEVLARVHGRNIVPQIGSIMTTIIRTLSTSAGSFPLHQACSRVVPAIARYGIDASTPDDEKKKIISSLTTPLSNALMSSHESLASGSALCLKVLVESNNWKFASDDTINDVCLKIAGALEEKITQTNSHMGLVMALAKHNSSIVEAYVGSLIRSGLHLLSIGTTENNSQKRFAAIQMINFLMKCIDSRSISSELADVADAMEKCQADHMPYVSGAAFEALQTAKAVASQKGSKCYISSSPVNHLNFLRRNEKSPQVALDKLGKSSPVEFSTPESQTITSSIKNENFTESPSSIKQTASNGEYLGKRAQRRLWSNDLGGVDLSFKDSFLIKERTSKDIAEVEGKQVKDDDCHEMRRANSELAESFAGFVLSNAGSKESRDTTPSPQSSEHQLTFDHIKIYSTPRKLVRSLQNQNDCKMEVSSMLGRSPVSCKVQPEPTDESDSQNSDISIVSHQKFITDAEEVHQSIESVSSTNDPAEDKGSETTGISADAEPKRTRICGMTKLWYRKFMLVFALAVICLAIIMTIQRDDVDEFSYGLAPT
ncbi:hypothetical protein IEQ34_015435 [Dendrobium chrysotoxum]|uniref:TORTIFOLIA1/SINE1-2 N-terminal domain-containing protein n=1 Tax=Dendrobium chrysotoxum TaxID=161865 RepID=A0AAV7GIZ4_DENCH|nr:hypothetical protein IEQ34_015435 [Dendrobium chrysotoxum]